MFKKIQAKTSRNINVVKIDNINIENLGLYLDKDFELSYIQEREVEEKPVPGREMPYHIVKKRLPITFSIEFNLKETTDFYGKIDYIRNFLESKKEKVMTFNGENKGFKIYWFDIRDITRVAGASTITINFQCYPNIYNI